jgi:hypothetical protein
MTTEILTAEQREQITQVHWFVRAASAAARFKVADWAYAAMGDAEFRDLTTYLNMNVDRLIILAQQVIEGIRAEDIPALYLDCLIRDWEFSWDSNQVPDADNYWPKGLDFGLDAIHAKHNPKEK